MVDPVWCNNHRGELPIWDNLKLLITKAGADGLVTGWRVTGTSGRPGRPLTQPTMGAGGLTRNRQRPWMADES